MLIDSSPEMFWLLMTVAMTALMWLPYILNRMWEQGVVSAIWDPHGHTEAKAAWASRMMSAHGNAVENLVILAPLVLMLVMTGSATAKTALAVQVYFIARLVHYLAFSFAVPVLRVLSFLAGFSVQLLLVINLFG
ncbi:MAG: MAPEG family protein [Gammaproteobacteria bacterium]